MNQPKAVLAMFSPPGGEGGNIFEMMFPFLMIFVIIYFLMLRPQLKKQKEEKAMRENLKKGDMVIAAGGIAGTISGFDDKVGLVTLQIGGDIRIEVTRASVQSVRGSAPVSGGEGGQRRSGRKRGGGR